MLRRYSLDGFYDRGKIHGAITGSGPGFNTAMRKHTARLERLRHPGRWRYKTGIYKVDNGTYIDRDWDIIDF